MSAISCMSVAGILDVQMVKDTSDGDTFYDFVQSHLIPHLMPYNGVNPHSVVILDNCSIYHCSEVVTSLKDVGVLVPTHMTLTPLRRYFLKSNHS